MAVRIEEARGENSAAEIVMLLRRRGTENLRLNRLHHPRPDQHRRASKLSAGAVCQPEVAEKFT